MSRYTGLLLFALASGCLVRETPFGLGAPRTSDWYDTGKVLKSRPEITRTVQELLVRQGYRLAPAEALSDRMETEWDTHLSNQWREGFRVKLEAEIEPLDGGGFNVRIRSHMEINENSTNPGAEAVASWVPAGVSEKHKDRIATPALQIQTQLKTRFFGLNP